MSKLKRKIVYSLDIQIKLQKRGFRYECCMPNPHNERYMCWVYENTPEFAQAFDEILRGGR